MDSSGQEYTYFMGISMNNNRVPFVKTLTKLGYFLDGLDISEPNITTVMYRGKYLGLNSSVFIPNRSLGFLYVVRQREIL